MIRYEVDLDRLHILVDGHKPGWRTRAGARTEAFRKKGKYKEEGSIWGEIKAVFMELQGQGKCCFCERKFEGSFRQYELDMEHFRPKRKVRKWRSARNLVAQGVSLTTPPAKNNGYYLLSYHLLNYAVACKPCNSGLKKDYFPIAGQYDFGGTDPREMNAEQPWLLYPIGQLDADPEEVISFYGILPQSQPTDPTLRSRGLVTIEFFGLDDVIARKDLMRGRAQTLCLLHHWLVKATDECDAEAEARVASMDAQTAEHANCARSFDRLFRRDRPRAREVADDAAKFLRSMS